MSKSVLEAAAYFGGRSLGLWPEKPLLESWTVTLTSRAV